MKNESKLISERSERGQQTLNRIKGHIKEFEGIAERSTEENDYTKGFKRRIIELVRNNPFESECDITDAVLGVKEILQEFARHVLKAKEESLPEATDLPLYKMKEKLSHDYAVTFPEYQYQAARSGYEAGFVKAQFHFESKEDNKGFGEQEFCRMYTSYHGEEIDNIKQLVRASFTGEELMEFVKHCLDTHKPE